MKISTEKLHMTLESPERIKLEQLEKEGKWVFHGSGSQIEILKPHQAHIYPKNSEEEKIPDDKPAVFASPSVDIAIFMAVINRENAPKGTRSGFSGYDNGGVEFRATQDTMDQIHDATGYVYVFDKSKFIVRSENESLSYDAVVPDDVVVVHENDLPKNIEIKDF